MESDGVRVDEAMMGGLFGQTSEVTPLQCSSVLFLCSIALARSGCDVMKETSVLSGQVLVHVLQHVLTPGPEQNTSLPDFNDLVDQTV